MFYRIIVYYSILYYILNVEYISVDRFVDFYEMGCGDDVFYVFGCCIFNFFLGGGYYLFYVFF